MESAFTYNGAPELQWPKSFATVGRSQFRENGR